MSVVSTFGKRPSPQGRENIARTAANTLAGNAPEGVAAAHGRRKEQWPILTAILSLALLAVFCAEQRYSVHTARGFGPGVPSLIALGGVDHYLVFQRREWWRLFTAPLLHGGVSHLIGNLTVLAMAGRRLEGLIGRAWLAAAFALGGLAGGIGSITLNDAQLVSVGASGAIICLVALLFVLSFHCEAADQANRLRRFSLFLLIPALLPSAASGGAQVDVGAHLGGVLIGTALGFFLLTTWPETGEQTPFRPAAGLIGAAGLAAALLAAMQMTQTYPAYAARAAGLMPSYEIPRSLQQANATAPDLVQRFPHDPMAHLLRGIAFLEQNDVSDAEEQIRQGLAEKETLALEYPSELTQRLETVLAMTLTAEGKLESAKVAAAPICALSSTDEVLKRGLAFLKEHSACP